MKKANKKMNLRHQTKSSFANKIICILYIIFVIMSIACHNITNLGGLIQEIITYTILGLMVKISIENISLEELKELFD